MKLRRLSKADTLVFLKKYQKKLKFYIPKTYVFKLGDYKLRKKLIIKNIIKKFNRKKIIIRSSSLNEDQLNKSLAGKYDSFSDIKCESKILEKFINLVIKKFNNNNDQILIQEYIFDVDKAGVVFTRNLNNNAPYYYINYDTSGKTDLITSGKIYNLTQDVTISRFKIDINTNFKKLLNIIQSIEKIFSNDRLDIEFCIKNNKVFIFQCRSLYPLPKSNDNQIKSMLINIEKKIKKIALKNPFISGNTTYLSNMADWNPAEMIGSKPKNLSSSLYAELITDNVWAKQRNDYGYRNVLYQPLMFSLGGSPYIDLRLDLNSFIPKNLSSKIGDKIVSESLRKIKKKPYLHDKIEFDIIDTCFNIEKIKKNNHSLNKKDSKIYTNALNKLSLKIIKKNVLDKEKAKIEILQRKFIHVKKSKLSEIQKIYILVQNCKNYGTLPFSGAARCAFIATKILKSFKKLKIFDQNELENFYSSIKSVTNQINNDLFRLKNKKIKKNKFLEKYGHLRPSSYSISSLNYKENFSKYFPNESIIKKKNITKFKISKNKLIKIDNIFKKNKINLNSKEFLNFAKSSIYSREKFKLIFTKCIDLIFENLISLGKEMNIKREDLEFISIQTILKAYNNVNLIKLKKILINEINENKKNFKYLNLIDLPDIIFKPEDIYNFYKPSNKPNYITEKNVVAKCLSYNNSKDKAQLKNKIIILNSADPGYDFLFIHNIKGLITKYGGANSHMSIRCLELGIPAMIGVGEDKYNEFILSNTINIDCLNKTYKILN